MRRDKMYIEERHQAILDIIAENGRISTATIQKKFGVGYESAKRDLRILEEKGLLRRTHGGAIPVGELSIGKPKHGGMFFCEPSEHELSAARRAFDVIKDGETVFIGNGSISFQLAKLILESGNKKGFRIVTSSPKNAALLSDCNGIRVIMLGGEVSHGEISGSFAATMLSRLRIDTAFIETEYYSKEFGLSCNSEKCGFLEAITAASRSVVVIRPENAKPCEGDLLICPPDKIEAVI